MREFFLLLVLSSCRLQPTNTAVRPTREIHVTLEDGVDGTGWFQSHRVALGGLWSRMDRTGYRWVFDARTPEVIVQTFDAHGCERSAGEYLLGSRVVHVDPACLHGDEELRFAVMHELLHWLTWRDHRWAGHLCKKPGAVLDCHPSVFGVGVLSPVLGELDLNYGMTTVTASATLSTDDVRLLTALRSE